METQSPPAAPCCQHIFPDNRRCKAPALRNRSFCHWHQSGRDSTRRKKIVLPILEDANSIQLAISQVLRQLMNQEITPFHAQVAFYGISIASHTEPKVKIYCGEGIETELPPALAAELEQDQAECGADIPVREAGDNEFPTQLAIESPDHSIAGSPDPQIPRSPDGPTPPKKPAASAIPPRPPCFLTRSEVRYMAKLLDHPGNDQAIRDVLTVIRDRDPEKYAALLRELTRYNKTHPEEEAAG